MDEPEPIYELPGMILPRTLAFDIGLMEAMEDHVERTRKRIVRFFRAPRFIGIYFNHTQPVAICQFCRANLPLRPEVRFLWMKVDSFARRERCIVAEKGSLEPPFIVVHDSLDGSCWLYPFEQGRRFLTVGPVFAEKPSDQL